MKPSERKFEDRPAVREQVPLLVGLMGPSGSGKTFSALRLATGIQQVTGGEIYVIDTEARRALHYADMFKFRHIEFNPPFGSLDYLAAVQHCVSKGGKVIVIDSMSHEHDGPGGYLLSQEAELTRMAGEDSSKRERVKFSAWIKPAGMRRQMINGLLQLNANFIFCFRAKEKIKPVTGGQPIHLGFMPIAGEEMLFEQTVNCLLLPKSGGVPTWRSDQVGETLMMKLPRQFEDLFSKQQPLSEDIGRQLAEWAKGGAEVPKATGTSAKQQDTPPAATEATFQDKREQIKELLAHACNSDDEIALGLAWLKKTNIPEKRLDEFIGKLERKKAGYESKNKAQKLDDDAPPNIESDPDHMLTGQVK